MNTNNNELVNVFLLQNKDAAKENLKVLPSTSPGLVNVSVLQGRVETAK